MKNKAIIQSLIGQKQKLVDGLKDTIKRMEDQTMTKIYENVMEFHQHDIDLLKWVLNDETEEVPNEK